MEKQTYDRWIVESNWQDGEEENWCIQNGTSYDRDGALALLARGDTYEAAGRLTNNRIRREELAAMITDDYQLAVIAGRELVKSRKTFRVRKVAVG